MLKGLGCTRLRATTAKKVSCQVRTLGASAATRLGPRTHQRQPGGKAARLNKNQGTKVHAYFQDDEPEEPKGGMKEEHNKSEERKRNGVV